MMAGTLAGNTPMTGSLVPRMPPDPGEPKTMINLANTFVYTLGHRRRMPVPAASTNSSYNLVIATAGIEIFRWSHLQEKWFPTAYYIISASTHKLYTVAKLIVSAVMSKQWLENRLCMGGKLFSRPWWSFPCMHFV